MDDLTLMHDFRAERVAEDPRARADAWRALEARFETATASVPAPAARRRVPLLRRRRLFAFVGATALAAVLAGVIVLSSGPTAEPAAAEILHRAATVAAATDAPAQIPGPGQFFYRKFKRLELMGWIPGGPSSGGAPYTGNGEADAFTALVPTTQEWWDAPDGAGRVREVGGTPRFLSHDEQVRWEAAGSRLPAPFDPEYQRKYPLAYGDALEARRGVVDTEHAKLEGFHFPNTSGYPTDPEALRHFVENHRIRGGEPDDPTAEPLDAERTIAGLFDILIEGISTTPQLRAAAFNALAELPGIKVDTDASDFLGRRGYAVRLVDHKRGGGLEFIFDPDTAQMLANREYLADPSKNSLLRDFPAGQTIRETAYLGSAVVDSRRETGAEAAADGPVATTGPDY